MDEEKHNGRCQDQSGGCLEFRLLETRVKVVEDFITDLKDEQKWHRRWQKSTTVGVFVAVGLLILKIFILG